MNIIEHGHEFNYDGSLCMCVGGDGGVDGMSHAGGESPYLVIVH